MRFRFPTAKWRQVSAIARSALIPSLFSLLMMVGTVAAALLPALPVAAQGTIPSEPAAPDWLEPRGLNIVDMVGFVEEGQLRDAILVYETGTGLVQYDSGSRSGNSVVINVKMVPRYGPGFTVVGCLAQPAAYDQWPSYMPAGTLQVFADGRDVTAQIVQFDYTPAGLVQPTNDASGYFRYPRTARLAAIGASPLKVPANGSCQILISGKLQNLTARYTFSIAPQVSISFAGDQTFYAHSYIGEGEAGALASLSKQMLRRFGTRHDSFALTVPTGAEYMFVRYAPTPVDPYAEPTYSFGLPGSGTYRFDLASTNWLSVDHVNSMGIPTAGNWRDSDQMGNSSFLDYVAIRGRIKTPEYFLPPGIAYDTCMTNGGCPDTLLDLIYNQTFPVQVYYYKVARLAGAQLTRVPLKMVGKGWLATGALAAQDSADGPFNYLTNPPAAPAHADSSAVAPAVDAAVAPAQTAGYVYLPLVGKNTGPVVVPPDDPTGCPCGWFDAQGRMVDFIPPK